MSYHARLARALLSGGTGEVSCLGLAETLERIVNDNVSLSRFGDGEFIYALRGRSLAFQPYDSDLARRLEHALLSGDSPVLRCFNGQLANQVEVPWIARYPRYTKTPDRYVTLHEPGDIAVFTRRRQQRSYRNYWRIIGRETAARIYGDACVFFLGLYVDQYRAGRIDQIMELFRALFSRRRILFVAPRDPVGGRSFREQGEALRALGVKEADFIDIPARDAFAHIDAIAAEIVRRRGYDDVFIQAGPAASVLAFELAGDTDARLLDVGSLNTQLPYIDPSHLVK